MTDSKKRIDYDPWHRLRRKPNTTKDIVTKAFSEAWKEGKTFSITLSDLGDVRIRKGSKLIATYQDADAFARDFFPEEFNE